jgi:hypothetical protein
MFPSLLGDNLGWGEGTIRGLSLQIRYKWTGGAYHSLPAPVHTIPLVQIRAPLDIHNTVDSGNVSGLLSVENFTKARG